MKTAWARLGIRAKLIAAMTAVIVLLTASFALIVLDRVRRAQEAEIDKRGRDLAQDLGRRAEFPLRIGDREDLQRLARQAVQGEDVLAAAIFAADGGTVAQAKHDAPWPPRFREFSAQVRAGRSGSGDEIELLHPAAGGGEGERIGGVRLTLSLAPADRLIRSLRSTMAVVALILAGIAILVSIQLSRRLTGPLLLLAREVDKVGQGRLDTEVALPADADLARLAEQFNRMIRDLKLSLDRMIQQEKMAGLGRMAAGITHEVGSPLNSILLDAKLLLDNQPPGPDRECAEAILFQARKMRDIINHMLEYARTPPTDMQAIDLNSALDEALRVLSHPLRKSGLSVVREVPPDLPKVQGIMNRCVQLFVNVISNAIEATGNNGSLVIEAHYENPASRLILTMKDNGPGIPEADLEAVFDPFFTTKPDGTGLGLAICRQIMRGFGGDILVKPCHGQGAEFELEFAFYPPKN